MRYLITMRRNDLIGSEEYSGGNTIEEARKEAAFFVENTPAHVTVKICAVNKLGSLVVKEIARDGAHAILQRGSMDAL